MNHWISKICAIALLASGASAHAANTSEVLKTVTISAPIKSIESVNEKLIVQTHADGKLTLKYQKDGEQALDLPQFSELTAESVVKKAGLGWVRTAVKVVAPIPVALCAIQLGGYVGAVTTGLHVAENHGGLTPYVWALVYGYPMGMLVGGVSGYFIPFLMIPSAAKQRRAVGLLAKAINSPDGSALQSKMPLPDLIMGAAKRMKVKGVEF